MKIAVFFILILVALPSVAKKLSDYSPYEYDLRFTNPSCKTYFYDEPIKSKSGEWLKAKPKNAYCRSSDAVKSGQRSDAPLQKLLSWIHAPSTKEIFFTYLSFSNSEVREALCQAVEQRDVKIRFVLDEGTGLTQAKKLLKCQASQSQLNPELFLRGHVSGIGYAHNKIFIVNPSSASEIKIAFGSGNMSSGIVLHHENWHFVTTNVNSYFAQAHLCVMNAEIDHADSGRNFRRFMQECLDRAEEINPPEEDIQLFFVPGQGREALSRIEEALSWASEVKIAAHRFSYTRFVNLLKTGLEQGLFRLRLVFDDDIYWGRRPNSYHDWNKAELMIQSGADVRYIETNHRHRLLHHNKFIVFKDGQRRATFLGAGNFTGTAFSTNLENFYYIEIPEVALEVSRQFEHLFEDLGTAEANLPAEESSP